MMTYVVCVLFSTTREIELLAVHVLHKLCELGLIIVLKVS